MTARVSAAAAGEAVVMVDGAAALLAVERAASDVPSCVLKSAPSIPFAGDVADCEPEFAPVEAWELMAVIAFRVSPPLGEWFGRTTKSGAFFFYRSPPGET